jgi:H+/Cl- antiporter ClcA
MISMGVARRIAMRVRHRFGAAAEVLLPTLGGLIFGSIGYALPLSLGDGLGHLPDVVRNYKGYGLQFLLCLGFAKIVTFSVSFMWGFVGGVLLPSMFIGIIFGVAAHIALPEIPLIMCTMCMLASVPGGFAPLPLTLALLPILIIPCTSHQALVLLTPILISQIICYALTDGLLFHHAMRILYPRDKQESGEVTNKDLARNTGFY